MSKEKLYWISFAVTGDGSASVMATSKEDAIAKFWEGSFVEKPEVQEWDVHSDGYDGGYIEAVEDQ